MSGSKILEGLKNAVAGNFASVTIEGQRWVRDLAPEATQPGELSDILGSYRIGDATYDETVLQLKTWATMSPSFDEPASRASCEASQHLSGDLKPGSSAPFAWRYDSLGCNGGWNERFSMHKPPEADYIRYVIPLYAAAPARSTASSVEPVAWQEPTDAQLSSACMSYRHDYGLLDATAQQTMKWQAKEWLIAWRKEGFGCDRNEVIERCAVVVDKANKEGPYQAIAAASRIRALKGVTDPRNDRQTGGAQS